ncbi:MAG TPA: PhzF family phenazine biosynthesis protein [Symbiobacteriaceae bacterium]|nr:PhzF family phenazine biosynthesis protein [Symbiobacteriaceae bacterium]
MRALSYLWLDVFADRPFAGNAHCVILDGAGLHANQMQAISRETNAGRTRLLCCPPGAGPTPGPASSPRSMEWAAPAGCGLK